MLPCQHIFHRDIEHDFLTEERWIAFRDMFVESGFDIYHSHVQIIEEEENDPRAMEAEQQRLQFYAAQEQLREQWFQLEAEFRQNGVPVYRLTTIQWIWRASLSSMTCRRPVGSLAECLAIESNLCCV